MEGLDRANQLGCARSWAVLTVATTVSRTPMTALPARAACRRVRTDRRVGHLPIGRSQLGAWRSPCARSERGVLQIDHGRDQSELLGGVAPRSRRALRASRVLPAVTELRQLPPGDLADALQRAQHLLEWSVSLPAFMAMLGNAEARKAPPRSAGVRASKTISSASAALVSRIADSVRQARRHR